MEYRWQTRALIQLKPVLMISCTCRMGHQAVDTDNSTHSHKVTGIHTQRQQLLQCNQRLTKEHLVLMAKQVRLINLLSLILACLFCPFTEAYFKNHMILSRISLKNCLSSSIIGLPANTNGPKIDGD